ALSGGGVGQARGAQGHRPEHRAERTAQCAAARSRGSTRAGAAGIVAALLFAAACKAAPDEPSGIGAWDVTHTTRKDATGRCDPTDLPDGRRGTWCYMQQPLTIGGQPAQVDLYFAGSEPTAPLIELQLKVAACDIDKIETWGRTSFGAPTSHGG